MKKMEKRKQKLLLIVPLPLAFFAALLFYGLGGGNTKKANGDGKLGINTSVPTTKADGTTALDKLSIYMQADQDSAKKADLLSKDPFFQQTPGQTPAQPTPQPYIQEAPVSPFNVNAQARSMSGLQHYSDSNEQKVRSKLAELQKQLQSNADNNAAQGFHNNPIASLLTDSEKPATLPDFSALTGQTAKKAPDPEMEQINGMLEKVLDIQHPERVKDRLQEISAKEKTKVFPVQAQEDPIITDLFRGREMADSNNRQGKINNRFYELSTNTSVNSAGNAIAAVIHDNQSVVSGATIKLRLEQDMYVQGTLIPAGSFVHGEGKLNGDRYLIDIKSIHFGNSVFPVKLSVFGLDGLEGVQVDGAISREVAKQGIDQGLQSMQLSSLDPSLSAQAASAGIETVKTLLSRKTRLVKVLLKAGHPVLLKDNSGQ
jgi:conjugative transposon TraM protein